MIARAMSAMGRCVSMLFWRMRTNASSSWMLSSSISSPLALSMSLRDSSVRWRVSTSRRRARFSWCRRTASSTVARRVEERAGSTKSPITPAGAAAARGRDPDGATTSTAGSPCSVNRRSARCAPSPLAKAAMRATSGATVAAKRIASSGLAASAASCSFAPPGCARTLGGVRDSGRPAKRSASFSLTSAQEAAGRIGPGG